MKPGDEDSNAAQVREPPPRSQRLRSATAARELERELPLPEFARWLAGLIRGVDVFDDPDAGRPTLDGKAPRGHAPVSPEIKMKAAAMYLDRVVGKPKAHVVLEGGASLSGTIKHEVTGVVGLAALDARDLERNMPGESLAEFRKSEARRAAALREIAEAARARLRAIADGKHRALGAGRAPVLDVESSETRTPEASGDDAR